MVTFIHSHKLGRGLPSHPGQKGKFLGEEAMQPHLDGLPVVHLDHVEIKAVDALSGCDESAAFGVKVEPNVDQHLREGGEKGRMG